MAEQIFIRAATLQEALEEKAAYGRRTRIIAGGTDLMVQINTLAAAPERLLYIGRAGLDTIEKKDGGLELGAGVTLTTLASSKIVSEAFPALSQAAGHMASWAVRNRGTLGGNLSNASPAADTAPPLLALGAAVNLVSLRGERRIPITEFFTGPGSTCMAPDEILSSVWIPLREDWRMSYRKIGRRKAETLSVISVCVALENRAGAAENVKIALGAAAPVPMLANKAMAALEGRPLCEELVKEAGRLAAGEASPIDDQRASAWYRKRVISAVVAESLREMMA